MEHKDVPFIVLESAEARHERIEKRLIIALVIVTILMFVTNALWLYHESLYDYSTEDIELRSESGNSNYIGESGDINN